jgi:uncharacterized protein YdbL (DUF1318 family)
LKIKSQEENKMNRKFFSIFLLLTGIVSFSTLAFAARYDIKEKTPEVQRAFDGRKSRYPEIKQHKANGALSENNEGLLQAKDDKLQSLAAAENQDRMTIYQAIANQNNLGPNGLSIVKQAFAEAHRERDNS